MSDEHAKFRVAILAGEKFISVADLKEALRDDAFVDRYIPLLKVGLEKGHDATQILRVTIAAVLFDASGETTHPEHN